MAYDDSKDKYIAHVGSVPEGNDTISVGLYSYNGGPVKVGISRTAERRSGDIVHSKLGRLNPETLEALIPLLQQATAQAKLAA